MYILPSYATMSNKLLPHSHCSEDLQSLPHEKFNAYDNTSINFFNSILQIEIDKDGKDVKYNLKWEDIVQLTEYLSFDNVSDFHRNSPDLLSKLVSILGEVLVNSEPCLNFPTLFKDYQQHSSSKRNQLRKATAEYQDDSLFSLCLKYLTSANLLIRVSTALLANGLNSQIKPCDIISSEQLEIAISYIKFFIIDNHSYMSETNTYSEHEDFETNKENQIPNKSSKRQCVEESHDNDKTNDEKALFEFIVSPICILVTRIISSFELLLLSSRQPNKIIVSITETCLSILCLENLHKQRETDKDINSKNSCDRQMQIDDSNLISNLHQSTVLLFRTIFRYYPNHRVTVLNDATSLLYQVLNKKIPIHNYQLSKGLRTSSVALDRPVVMINVVVATILLMLQSMVYNSSSSLHCSPFQNCTESNSNNINTKTRETKESMNDEKNEIDISNTVIDCRKACFLVVSIIFKRCFSEMHTEHKVIVAHFVDQVLLALNCPELPIASILLDVIVLNLQTDLSNYLNMSLLTHPKSKSTINDDTKKMNTYTMFGMNLLTEIGKKMSDSFVCCDNGATKAKEASGIFPQIVQNVLKKKLKKFENMWLLDIQKTNVDYESNSSSCNTFHQHLVSEFESEETSLQISKHESVLRQKSSNSNRGRKSRKVSTNATAVKVSLNECQDINDDMLVSQNKTNSNLETIFKSLKISTQIRALAFNTLLYSHHTKTMTSTNNSGTNRSSNCADTDSLVKKDVANHVTPHSVDRDEIVTPMNNNQSQSLLNINMFTIPSAADILKQCDSSIQLIEYIEKVEHLDQDIISIVDFLNLNSHANRRSLLICDETMSDIIPYLTNKEQVTTSTSASIARNRIKRLYDSRDDFDFLTMDAITLTLVLWYEDALKFTIRRPISTLAKLLLQQHIRRLEYLDVPGQVQPLTQNGVVNLNDSIAITNTNSFSGTSVARINKTTSQSSSEFNIESDLWKDYFSTNVISIYYRQLLVNRQFRTRFESILKSLLLQFSASSPLIRSRVIKSLSSVMTVDNSLIQRTVFRESIIERLNDVAISVREECVRLVGSFLLKGFDTPSHAYLDALLTRLNDKGVSVRKAVVNIFKEILISHSSNVRCSEICNRLIERASYAKEEDSIKDLIRETFLHIWFTSSTSLSTSNMSSSHSSLNHVSKMKSSNIGNNNHNQGILTLTGSLICPLPKGWSLLQVVSSDFSTVTETPIANSKSISQPSNNSHIISDSGSTTITTTNIGILSKTKRETRSMKIQQQQQTNCVSFVEETPPPSHSSENDITNNDQSSATTTTTTPPVYVSPKGERYNTLTAALQSCDLPTDVLELALIIDKKIPTNSCKKYEEFEFDMNARNWAKQTICETFSAKDDKINICLSNDESVTFQLMDVISKSNHRVWISNLVEEVLQGKLQNKGTDSKKTNQINHLACIKKCESIIHNIIEVLLKAEENDVKLSTHYYNHAGSHSTMSEKIVVCILSLSVFAEAYPPLLIPYVANLVPYLKLDNSLNQSQQAVVTVKIIEILSALVVLDNVKLGGLSISDIISDLKKIALNFNASCVSAAIKCLSLIATYVTLDPEPLYKLTELCYSSIISCVFTTTSVTQLHHVNDTTTTTSSIENNNIKQHSGKIIRCLVVLGSICEHYKKVCELFEPKPQEKLKSDSSINLLPSQDFDAKFTHINENEGSRNITNVKLSNTNVLGAVYVLSLYLLKSSQSDIATKSRAIQTFCSTFIGCPRLILHAQNMGILGLFLDEKMSSTLSSNCWHWQLVYNMFNSFTHMMMSEEARLEKKNSLSLLTDSGVAVNHRVQGPQDNDSDVTVAGFVLQNHLSSILRYLHHHVKEMRQSSLGLITVLLRQGMLCPIDVIPEIISLQGDADDILRFESLTLLQLLDEKYPNCIESRFLNGIELTHAMQLKIYMKTAATIETVSKLNVASDETDKANINRTVCWSPSIFQSVFSTCFQSTKRRCDLFCSLLRRMNCLIESVNDSHHVVTLDDPTSHIEHQKSSISSSNTVGTAVTNRATSFPLKYTESSSVDRSMHDLSSLLIFYIQTLAHTQYDRISECLSIIYWIDRNVPIQLNSLITEMKASAQALNTQLLLDNAIDVTKTKKVSSKQHSNVLSNEVVSKSALQSSQLICDENVKSKVITLISDVYKAKYYEIIMQLKYYLKFLYNISETQCSSFSPYGISSNNDKCKTVMTDTNQSSVATLEVFEFIEYFNEINKYTTTETYSKETVTHIIQCATKLSDVLEEKLNCEDRMAVCYSKKRKKSPVSVAEKDVTILSTNKPKEKRNINRKVRKTVKKVKDIDSDSDSDEDYEE